MVRCEIIAASGFESHECHRDHRSLAFFDNNVCGAVQSDYFEFTGRWFKSSHADELRLHVAQLVEH